MSRKSRKKNGFWKFLFVKLPLAFIALSVFWVLVLKWVPVWVTPLMLRRSIEFRDDKEFRTTKNWVTLDEISSKMIKAVIASEDNLFPEHNGFDTIAIKQALKERAKGRRHRGASTISQQTAKNVFTFCTRTWARKGLEAYYTLLIEKIWGKERIMEVYLNVVEMGKGVYGVEAAARKYYRVPASKLTMSQCARLVACFPDPIHRSPLRSTKYMSSREAAITSLVGKLAWPDWVDQRRSGKVGKEGKKR